MIYVIRQNPFTEMWEVKCYRDDGWTQYGATIYAIDLNNATEIVDLLTNSSVSLQIAINTCDQTTTEKLKIAG